MRFCAHTRRVARFLIGRSAFCARPTDVFISSYPRSGAAWLQQIVHVLAACGGASYRHIGDVVPWFERELALGRRRAADFALVTNPRLFRSHLPHHWLPRGAKYIYLQRDGRDVACAYYQFYRSHLSYDGDFDHFLELFLRGDLRYGAWLEHVNAWRERAADPDVLLVDYEHMLDGLPGVLRRIARFCGFEHTDASLAELASSWQFESMQRHERCFDHATCILGADAAAGQESVDGHWKRGAFRDHFSAEQLRLFEQRLRASQRTAYREVRLWEFLQ